MDQPPLFISYSHKDEQYVRALARRLSEAGVEAWFFTESQRPGTSWPQRLLDIIRQARAVLVVISTASNSPQAEYVLSEVLLAQRERRFIIPLKIDQCSGPLDIVLAARNWITAWDGSDPLPKIAAALAAHFEGGPPAAHVDFAQLTVAPPFRAYVRIESFNLALPGDFALLEQGEPITVCRIGRDPRMDLVFAATLSFVSRHHALIYARTGREGVSFSIRDAQSRHGTFVNGVAAREQMLTDGDQIGLGMARAMLSFERVAVTGEPPDSWPHATP